MDQPNNWVRQIGKLLRPSQPVDLGTFQRLTSLFYGIAIVLAVGLFSADADLWLFLLLFMVPIVLVFFTMARRFTALGWNPVWMLVLWPFSSFLWIVLMYIPAENDETGPSPWKVSAGPRHSGLFADLNPRKIFVGLAAVLFLYGGGLLLVALLID